MPLTLGFIGREAIWLLPGLPFVAFVVLLFWRRYLPGQGAPFAILAIAASFLLFWTVLFDFNANGEGRMDVNWLETGTFDITVGLQADALSVLMAGLIILVSLAVQVYSLGYMRGEERFGLYYAYHSLFAASMLVLVLADSFLLLYVGWELVGLCSFLLIGFYFERNSAANAAKKAFITTRVGDVGLLIGLGILFVQTGTFDIDATFELLGGLGDGLLTAVALLMFLGAMGKSAQVPFHVWLPDAMEGPTPVSALIHAATMVTAGAFLVARAFPILEAAGVLGFVAGVGILTALFAGVLALATRDIKRVLAYSTVSQLGFMLLALGSRSVEAGMFHLATHGLFKALLFLCAGAVLHSIHRGNATVDDVSGIGWRRMPVTATLFAVGGLALAGVPPFSGFFSKEEILAAVLDSGNITYLVLALFGSFLTALYMTRLFVMLFLGPPRGEAERTHDPEISLTVPLVVLGGLAVVSGLALAPVIGEFLHGEGGFEVDPMLAAVSTLVALAGIALGYAIYRRDIHAAPAYTSWLGGVPRWATQGFYFDRAYQWAIDRIVLAGSEVTNLFDRFVINNVGVNGTANLSLVIGRRLRLLQSGQLANYALAIVAGVIALIGAAYVLN